MIYTLIYENSFGDRVEFSLKSGIIIGSASGFTENFIQPAMSQGIRQVGSTLHGSSVQSKTSTINGEIVGATAARRKLLLDTILPEENGKQGRLIYNGEWQISAVPTQTPIIEKNPVNARFQFILSFPFPYWRKMESTSTMLAATIPAFKFPWNMTLPYKFGERSQSQFTNVYNESNIPVSFNVVFRASTALDNPSITKVTTGEFIRIEKSMVAGETITVNTTFNRVSVMSNVHGVETDIFGYLDIDSTLFMLDRGDNVIQYNADSNADSLDCQIIFNVTTVGVY